MTRHDDGDARKGHVRDCYARIGQRCEGYLASTCRHCGRVMTLALIEEQSRFPRPPVSPSTQVKRGVTHAV